MDKRQLYNYISSLDDDEIKKISLEKDKKGCATKRALIAQKILWEKSGECFGKIYRNDYMI